MAAASGLNLLDGLDLFDTYGVAVKNISEFLGLHKPKEMLNHNWPNELGRDYDVSGPRLPDVREITLKCAFLCDTLAEYKTKSGNFFTTLTAPGYRSWNVVYQNTTYSVLYNGSSNPHYLGNKAHLDKVYLEFDLALIVQPHLIPAQSFDVTVNLNGVFHGTAAPGSVYNVVTLGQGVTPTVSNPTASVNNNTITVAATASTGYTIQYALEKKTGSAYAYGTFQNSNIFESVPNGTYRARVRLLEAVNTTATSNDVTVAYTAPAPTESLVITNATPYQDTIIILATKANTTRGVEYSLNGTTWQSSNVFTVPNGTYGPIYARLASPGASIVATWNDTVTINYTPPVTTYNTQLETGQSSGAVTYTGLPGTIFHFNNPLPAGSLPQRMGIRHTPSGTDLGMVDFPQGALEEPCGIEYNGTIYHIQGGFRNETLISVG